MFRYLATVTSLSLAAYATDFTRKIIGSLAAGVTRHRCDYTIALDFMPAITAQTDQLCEIADEVVTALS